MFYGPSGINGQMSTYSCMAVAIDKTNIFHVMSEILGLFMGARVGVAFRNMDDSSMGKNPTPNVLPVPQENFFF